MSFLMTSPPRWITLHCTIHFLMHLLRGKQGFKS
jgi:hypothetical protein